MVKGEKTKCIREAIQVLGFDATRSDAQAWLKQKYGFKPDDIAESTFYNIRRALLTQQAEAAPLPPEEKAAFGELHSKLTSLQTQADLTGTIKPEGSIVSIIRQLKQVVEKLGKNEVKELIDVL